MTKLLLSLVSTLTFVTIAHAEPAPTMPKEIVGVWCQVVTPEPDVHKAARFVRGSIMDGTTHSLICPKSSPYSGVLRVSENGWAQDTQQCSLEAIAPAQAPWSGYFAQFDCRSAGEPDVELAMDLAVNNGALTFYWDIRPFHYIEYCGCFLKP
jgi:hypothetical protein